MSSNSTGSSEDGALKLVANGSLLECDAENVDAALTLTITPSFSLAGGPSKRESVLIIVVDGSGSMGSQFRSQVVPALQYVAGKAFELGLEVKIIFYDDRAEIVEFDRENYMAVIGRLNTRGSTSFAAAFTAVTQALSTFKSTTFGEVDVVL